MNLIKKALLVLGLGKDNQIVDSKEVIKPSGHSRRDLFKYAGAAGVIAAIPASLSLVSNSDVVNIPLPEFVHTVDSFLPIGIRRDDGSIQSFLNVSSAGAWTFGSATSGHGTSQLASVDEHQQYQAVKHTFTSR